MSKVTKTLNQLQADSHALFLKLHNYHWNIKGMQFFPIHNTTEEAYDSMAELFDATAERAIQLGAKAITSPSELLSLTKIAEEKRDSFDAKTVLENMIKDYKYLIETLKELADAADDSDDSTTVALAEDGIADLEKKIWMLEATLA